MIHNLTVVSSATGGAGKSTVAAGLGCAFALLKEKTLLLDWNLLCGGPAEWLETGEETPYHLGDVSVGRCTLADAIFPAQSVSTLFLTRPPVTSAEFPGESMLAEWISQLSGEYDRVIADVPFWSPCFGILTQQAGETLLVVTPEQRSVACCDRLRTSSLGQQMAHPGLVINRFHRKQFWKEGAFSDLDEVIDRCGIPLRAVVPEDPFLAHKMTEVLAETTHYEKIPFRQKGKAGAVAIHCLAHRLQGERIPLRRLEGL